MSRVQATSRRTSRAYWQRLQQAAEGAPIAGQPPSWDQHLVALMPGPGSTCLEIGVVPGRALAHFAERYGLVCTGIDYSDRLAAVEDGFRKAGLRGTFLREDFFSWEATQRYDLVYSMGFIEHFDDYEDVVSRHWNLVAPGGLLVLSVPVLTPLQTAIRKLCYRPARYQQMLDAHNRAIMDFGELNRVVAGLPGSEPVASRYCGEMRVWISSRDPGVRRLSRIVLPPVRLLGSLAKRLGWSSRWFSPEICVAARKLDD